MDTYEQVRSLTAIIANFSTDGLLPERIAMEALLEVLEPQELTKIGYGDRVDAYLKEYGDWRENFD